MLEGYRVLMAMIALKEFTVEELAASSGVKIATVRNEIRQRKYFLDEVERIKTAKRGGQAIRYIIKDGHLTTLNKEIGELFAALRPQEPIAEAAAMSASLPPSLLAAENTLSRLYQKTTATDREQRHKLIKLAEAQLEACTAQINTEPTNAVHNGLAPHIESIRTLISLRKEELARDHGRTPRQTLEIFERFSNVASHLLEQNARERVEILLKCATGSAILNAQIPKGRVGNTHLIIFQCLPNNTLMQWLASWASMALLEVCNAISRLTTGSPWNDLNADLVRATSIVIPIDSRALPLEDLSVALGKLADHSRRVIVLDSDFSAPARNKVFEGKAIYYGRALTFTSQALAHLIEHDDASCPASPRKAFAGA